jgi:hypothetical protein
LPFRRLPENPRGVAREFRIRRHQSQTFKGSLGDQDAVEGVFVNRWQSGSTANLLRMQEQRNSGKFL